MEGSGTEPEMPLPAASPVEPQPNGGAPKTPAENSTDPLAGGFTEGDNDDAELFGQGQASCTGESPPDQGVPPNPNEEPPPTEPNGTTGELGDHNGEKGEPGSKPEPEGGAPPQNQEDMPRVETEPLKHIGLDDTWFKAMKLVDGKMKERVFNTDANDKNDPLNQTEQELNSGIDVLNALQRARTDPNGEYSWENGTCVDPRTGHIVNFRAGYDPVWRGLEYLAKQGQGEAQTQAEKLLADMQPYVVRNPENKVIGFNRELFEHNESIIRRLEGPDKWLVDTLNEWILTGKDVQSGFWRRQAARLPVVGSKEGPTRHVEPLIDRITQEVLKNNITFKPGFLQSSEHKEFQRRIGEYRAQYAATQVILEKTHNEGDRLVMARARLSLFNEYVAPYLDKVELPSGLNREWDGARRKFGEVVKKLDTEFPTIADYTFEPLKQAIDEVSIREEHITEIKNHYKFGHLDEMFKMLESFPDEAKELVNLRMFGGAKFDTKRQQELKDLMEKITAGDIKDRMLQFIGNMVPGKMTLLMALMLITQQLNEAAAGVEGGKQ